jgi:hypothetical protein
MVGKTLIKETLLDASACKQGGLRRDSLRPRFLGRSQQQQGIDTIGGKKSQVGG